MVAVDFRRSCILRRKPHHMHYQTPSLSEHSMTKYLDILRFTFNCGLLFLISVIQPERSFAICDPYGHASVSVPTSCNRAVSVRERVAVSHSLKYHIADDMPMSILLPVFVDDASAQRYLEAERGSPSDDSRAIKRYTWINPAIAVRF